MAPARTRRKAKHLPIATCAEIGQHHHIARPHLGQYAGEMAWREDMRRNATGTQFHACGRLALGHPPSPAWAGYWQRHRRREEVRRRLLDRRSARKTPWPAPSDASSPRLLRRSGRVLWTFHWTRTKLARSAGSSPVSIITASDEVWCADRRTRPTKRIEHTAATNLLVRTGDQIGRILFFDGIVSGSIAGANRRNGSVKMNQISAENCPFRCWARAIIREISARLLASADTT